MKQDGRLFYFYFKKSPDRVAENFFFSGLPRWRNGQRAILNFTTVPQGLTSILGVNLVPRVKFMSQGGMFTPSIV
jgi:hypothetical protein